MNLIRKRIIAVVLTCAMITTMFATVVMPVGAEENKSNELYTYYSPTTDYSAQKISHPGTGVGVGDGVVDKADGQPNEGLSYAWSAVGYGDYVYVGLLDSAIYTTVLMMGQTMGFTTEQVGAFMDVLWNGEIFSGPLGLGCIVKMNTKTNEVKIIEQGKTRGYRNAVEFNDKLYFVNTKLTPELLEIDPKTDEVKVVYQSELIKDKRISSGIRAICEHNNTLVFTTNTKDGPIMLQSENPSLGQESFKVIGTNEDLLNYPAYYYQDAIFGGSVWDMVSFNDKLYISVVTGKYESENPETPFALFSAKEENGKWKYTPLVGKEEDTPKYPLGLGADRSLAANLYVYDNHLYIGGYNDPMTALPDALFKMNFRRLYQDLDSPVQVWRMDNNEEVELVAGDNNKIFPNALGNMKSGLGCNRNQYVWRMADYNDKLYLGVFDIGSLAYPIMQFTNGDVLKWDKDDIAKEIKYIIALLNSFKPNTDKVEIAHNSQQSTASIKDNDVKLTEEDLAFIADNNNKECENTLENLKKELVRVQNSINSTQSDDSITIAKNSSEDNSLSAEELLETLVNLRAMLDSFKGELPEKLQELSDGVLSKINIKNFKYFIETCKYLRQGERGFSLLSTEDGVNFDIISDDGFGDPNNHGIRSFAKTDNGLVFGTANPFKGAQMWKIVDPDEPTPPKFEKGDVNQDGKVTIRDAVKLALMLSKSTTFTQAQKELADVDGNGRVAINDLVLVQGKIAKINKMA